MTLAVNIEGPDGLLANVVEGGSISFAPIPDEIVFNELGVNNQVYNYYQPLAGSRFILTGVVATADKDVVADATVIIYEATSPSETTVSKVLFQFVLLKNQQLVVPNFQVRVKPGVWVNAKSDDTDVHMSIIGHFVNFDSEKNS